MLVILRTWEAEIVKIMVPSKPEQKNVCETPISMIKGQTWWCVPVIPAVVGSIKQEDHNSDQPSKKQALCQNQQRKRPQAGPKG